MGMDANKVVERILPRIGHVHAKDTSFNEEALALNGLLDHRWPASPAEMPWNFAVPGRGHDEAWWHALIARFADSPVRGISIEHEDPFVDAKAGVKEAAGLLHRALNATSPHPTAQLANLTP
jgi:sugar phosphate isomerase/epimerase